MPKNNRNTYIGAIAVLILIGLFAWFSTQKNQVVEEAGEYDVFAQCLYDSGMRMYGSQTCSFCERQRQLFGVSFHFIQEIECDPRNPDSEYERCIEKGISHTPTWIFEDEKGEDVHRFDSGVQSLEDLSEVSGCPLL